MPAWIFLSFSKADNNDSESISPGSSVGNPKFLINAKARSASSCVSPAHRWENRMATAIPAATACPWVMS